MNIPCLPEISPSILLQISKKEKINRHVLFNYNVTNESLLLYFVHATLQKLTPLNITLHWLNSNQYPSLWTLTIHRPIFYFFIFFWWHIALLVIQLFYFFWFPRSIRNAQDISWLITTYPCHPLNKIQFKMESLISYDSAEKFSQIPNLSTEI